MKLISWNVNGIRACITKGFWESFDALDADFFCIQETKMQAGQADIEREGFHFYMNSALRKGYSGTAIYAKNEPKSVVYDIGRHNDEGRAITLEYENFYLLNVYVPDRKSTRLNSSHL